MTAGVGGQGQLRERTSRTVGERRQTVMNGKNVEREKVSEREKGKREERERDFDLG